MLAGRAAQRVVGFGCAGAHVVVQGTAGERGVGGTRAGAICSLAAVLGLTAGCGIVLPEQNTVRSAQITATATPGKAVSRDAGRPTTTPGTGCPQHGTSVSVFGPCDLSVPVGDTLTVTLADRFARVTRVVGDAAQVRHALNTASGAQRFSLVGIRPGGILIYATVPGTGPTACRPTCPGPPTLGLVITITVPG